MVNSKLARLYQDFILQHNRAPFNFVKMENASLVIEAYNPMCGDQFKLYPEMEGEVIKDLHFHGYGCSLSKASTSVLVKKVLGKSKADALEIIREFLSVTHSKEDIAAKVDPDFLPFANARNFPGREQCASLSWEHLEEYLKHYPLSPTQTDS